MTPERIHILGGPGSGKTRLALQLAALTGFPVHHLDDVARIGGGSGPLRSPDEREQALAAILAQPRWITDGVHLGWIRPLLDRADVIVWLDHVSWLTASRRITRRFAEGGVREARVRTGRERAVRFRDYSRHARALGDAIVSTRRYYAQRTDGAAQLRAMTAADTLGSRAATEAQLSDFTAKVVHVRTDDDLSTFLRRLSA